MLLLLTVFSSQYILSQNICSKIESTRYSFVSMKYESTLSLLAVYARNFDDRFLMSKLIAADFSLNEFSKVTAQLLEVGNVQENGTIDVRTVLDEKAGTLNL